MLASEYSPNLRGDLVLRELVDQSVQLRELVGSACLVASRAAMLSSAAQTVIMSRISALVLRTMKMPRRATMLHQALLIELGQRFAQRRAADAEALRQIALVEAQLGLVGVDVHVDDGRS